MFEEAIERAGRTRELPRSERRRALQENAGRGRLAEQAAARLEAERDQLAPVEHRARAEVAVIDHLLAERERIALAALQLSPPDYITDKLGERPSEPAKRRRWDRAVREIERYRRQHGIEARDSALGERPGPGVERRPWESQQRHLHRAQRDLELRQALSRARDIGIEL